MNPFESLQSLAMLWGKTAGQAFADADQNPFKAMADHFGQAAGGGEGASPAPSDAGYEKARQAFAQSWSTAQDLSTALARGLQGGSDGTQSDPVAAEMLAKIFDPRGWLSVTSEMDEALQRMAEGPRLADLWTIERKFAAVFTAWVTLRRCSLEHNAVVLEGWARAAGAFAKLMNERSERGEPPLESVRELLTLWGETANTVFLEMQRSDAFLASQRELLKASTDLRLAQRSVAEFYSEMFGFPSRAELDDVHKAVTDLRRELRVMKRLTSQSRPDQIATASGRPQPAPSSKKASRASAKRKEITA
jgi:polyhydroxyalkanoate synthase subunit PhaE